MSCFHPSDFCTQVTCTLSYPPSFVFHQLLRRGPSNHIYFLQEIPMPLLKLFQMTGFALPSLPPPDQVQPPSSRRFPSIFTSNLPPRLPCSSEVCSPIMPRTLEMGRGLKSKSLSLESARPGVERCDVMWWRPPCSSIGGTVSAQRGGAFRPAWPSGKPSEGGQHARKRAQGEHRHRVRKACRAWGDSTQIGFMRPQPHHRLSQVREGCVSHHSIKVSWKAESHLCDPPTHSRAHAEREWCMVQTIPRWSPGDCWKPRSLRFPLSFSYKCTVEFASGYRTYVSTLNAEQMMSKSSCLLRQSLKRFATR